MPQPSPRRRFWTYMALVFALAFLAIAGIRIWGMTQDHERVGTADAAPG